MPRAGRCELALELAGRAAPRAPEVGGSSTTPSPRNERTSPTSQSTLPKRSSSSAAPSVSGRAPRSTRQRAASGREPDARRAHARTRASKLRRGLEALVEQPRAPHPVEAEAARRVAVAIPGVDVPVREVALDAVRLDDARGGVVLVRAQVLDLDEALLARSRRRASGSAPPPHPRAAARASRAARTARTSPRASPGRARAGCGRRAAIIGPTNSSARRIARASSGVSRGGRRKASPNSSFSTRTSSPSRTA